jgi:hypothetical protein
MHQPRADAPPMVWARAGWTGSQRYPIQWGGDPQSDWEGLAASIRGGLSWGMSGAPYHSSDIGGFYGSVQPSAELYLRWLQATVFSSHIRVHGIGEREPWAFGPEAEAIARKWLAFRYRLIPYLKTVIDEAVRTGLPVMRAMPLAFPGQSLLRNYETQFLCGETLLVAPVLQPGGEVEVALPPGEMVRPHFTAALCQRAALQGRLDQPGVRARARVADGLRGPAHRRDRRGGSLEQLVVFGKPTRPLHGAAGQHHRSERRHVRDRAMPDVKVELATRRGSSSPGWGNGGNHRDHGRQPAGIGPELVALSRPPPRAPFPAHLVVIGPRKCWRARADRPRAAVCRLRRRVFFLGGFSWLALPIAAPVTLGIPTHPMRTVSWRCCSTLRMPAPLARLPRW